MSRPYGDNVHWADFIGLKAHLLHKGISASPLFCSWIAACSKLLLLVRLLCEAHSLFGGRRQPEALHLVMLYQHSVLQLPKKIMICGSSVNRATMEVSEYQYP